MKTKAVTFLSILMQWCAAFAYLHTRSKMAEIISYFNIELPTLTRLSLAYLNNYVTILVMLVSTLMILYVYNKILDEDFKAALIILSSTLIFVVFYSIQFTYNSVLYGLAKINLH